MLLENPKHSKTAVSTSLCCHFIRTLHCSQKQYWRKAVSTSPGSVERRMMRGRGSWLGGRVNASRQLVTPSVLYFALVWYLSWHLQPGLLLLISMGNGQVKVTREKRGELRSLLLTYLLTTILPFIALCPELQSLASTPTRTLSQWHHLKSAFHFTRTVSHFVSFFIGFSSSDWCFSLTCTVSPGLLLKRRLAVHVIHYLNRKWKWINT